MTITIIRHGKVNHVWKKTCTSAEFDQECSLYDSAPIEEMRNQSQESINRVYISALERTRQTAESLFGKMEFYSTNLINEVPLKSAFDTKVQLPLWFWNTLGRLQWVCNSKRQPETRRQTIDRAEQFVQELISKDEDCMIVTHGFFMHSLISVMKKHGFKANDIRVHYQNGEAILLEK